MSTSKYFAEGYEDYEKGLTKEDNPYDCFIQPKMFSEWKSGWKAAKFDKESLKRI